MANMESVHYSPSQSSSIVLYPADVLPTKSLPGTILSCVSKSESWNETMSILNHWSFLYLDFPLDIDYNKSDHRLFQLGKITYMDEMTQLSWIMFNAKRIEIQIF